MADLFDKLNVLMRARINSLITGSDSANASQASNLIGNSPNRNLNEAEHQIAQLRQHIDQALDSEDAMQKRLDGINADIALLDQQADEAVINQNDERARLLLQQMKNRQQQASSLASDLENHRRSTSDLIVQVNELESLVSSARQDQSGLLTPDELLNPLSNSPIPETIPIVTKTAPSVPQTNTTSIPIKIGQSAGVNDQIKQEIDQAKVEDDLAARRKRLSGPDQT